jgi:hypothetical protein
VKETPNHKIRYPDKGDPDALAAYWQHQAEDLERELDAIHPKQIVGGADGQLIIVKDGAPAFAAMKGDATLAEDGTLAIGDAKVSTKHLADNATTTAKLADKSVTETKLADGSVADIKLVSRNNAVWRHVASAETTFNLDRPAGLYAMAHGGPVANGGSIQTTAVSIFRLDAADYAVTGMKTKIRVAAQLLVNGVFPNTDFKVGLYRVLQAGGGADALTLNIGERVVGPATFASPSALAFLENIVSAEATLVTGTYLLGVETTAALANNSSAHLSAQLQMRHVP